MKTLARVRSRTKASSPTTVAAAALMLTVGMTACAGSDDDSAGADADRRSKAREVSYLQAAELVAADDSVPESAIADPGRIEEALNDVQVSVASGRGQGVCLELSKSGQRELAALQGGTSYQSCKDTITAISKRRRSAGLKTDISETLSVEVDGDRATAHVRDHDGGTRNVRFVSDSNGNWKLTALGSADPEAMEIAKSIGGKP